MKVARIRPTAMAGLVTAGVVMFLVIGEAQAAQRVVLGEYFTNLA